MCREVATWDVSEETFERILVLEKSGFPIEMACRGEEEGVGATLGPVVPRPGVTQYANWKSRKFGERAVEAAKACVPFNEVSMEIVEDLLDYVTWLKQQRDLALGLSGFEAGERSS